MKKRQFLKELRQTIGFLRQVCEKAEKTPAHLINDYDISVKAVTPHHEFWYFKSKDINDTKTA